MTDVARILVGPLVRLAAFSGVYGLHGPACAFGWSGTEIWGVSLMRLVLVLSWLVAIVLQVIVLAVVCSRRLGLWSAFDRSFRWWLRRPASEASGAVEKAPHAVARLLETVAVQAAQPRVRRG